MNRRNFLKTASTGALALTSGVALAAPKKKPNVVLIFIDDMGWKDAHFSGSDFYETPNLDALAKQGMQFTSAYAAAGNCAPSRACLISGQYTPRHAVYAVQSTNRGPKNEMRVVPIPNRTDLATENVTIAEGMKAAGYVTGQFGKWHLGHDETTMPKGQGFDTDKNRNPPSSASFKKTDDPKNVYSITDDACDFMETNKDRPFFAYVAHHATHMGIQAREAIFEMYAKKKPGKYQSNDKFGAMNWHMDDGVGRLLKKIKELGIEDNTLVLFTSDNGALPQSPQTPLRGFKGMYYEGGIRVPMIARWPGVIKPGTQCDTPVINLDFYPTFLDAGNSSVPRGKVLDGESLVPLFTGGKLKREAIFWHFPGYLDRPNPGSRDQVFRARPVTTMRKGDWKIHVFHEEWSLDGGKAKIDTNKSVEVYNLADDISEKNDLALKNKAKRDELLADVMAWWKKTGALVPSEKNPNYAPGVKGKTKKKKKA